MAHCAICHFGPKDGADARTLFKPAGSTRWACIRHLRFVVDVKTLAPGALRTMHALNDGTIDDTAADVTPKLH